MATARQNVVKHFQDKKQKFAKPADLAVALRQDQLTAKELAAEKEYVDTALKAGYKSPLFTELFKDVNGSAKVETEKK